MRPTQEQCDELAAFVHEWGQRIGVCNGIAGARVWMLAHTIVDSVGYHEVTRDGFELPDDCYADKCQALIAERWPE